jgi:hypothetical protein
MCQCESISRIAYIVLSDQYVPSIQKIVWAGASNAYTFLYAVYACLFHQFDPSHPIVWCILYLVLRMVNIW